MNESHGQWIQIKTSTPSSRIRRREHGEVSGWDTGPIRMLQEMLLLNDRGSPSPGWEFILSALNNDQQNGLNFTWHISLVESRRSDIWTSGWPTEERVFKWTKESGKNYTSCKSFDKNKFKQTFVWPPVEVVIRTLLDLSLKYYQDGCSFVIKNGCVGAMFTDGMCRPRRYTHGLAIPTVIHEERCGSRLREGKWRAAKQVDIWGNRGTRSKPHPGLWTTQAQRRRG